MRALAVLLIMGCAVAEDPSPPATAPRDSGTVALPDTRVAVDTGAASPDTTVEDTFVEEDSGAPVEDTAAPDTLVDSKGRVLVYDDYPALPSRASLAVAAVGETPIPCDYTNALSTITAGGFDLMIIEAPNANLPPDVAPKLIDWMKGGGRLILSHWRLDIETALTAELSVVATKYATVRPIHKDPGPIDLFTKVPTPITGTGTMFTVHGFTLSVSSPDAIAARVDSNTGEGAIAITHGGKVIVNGFLLADFANTDGDGDGKPDVQALLENEIRYVRSK